MSERPKRPTAGAEHAASQPSPRRKLSGDVELEIDLLRRAATPAEPMRSAPGEDTASVLIVDDDADMRRYVRRSLQAMELPIGRIFEAEDAAGALRVLATDHIDVLITDLVLAGTDGLALTRLVCAEPSTADVAVLLMTGKASYRETVHRAREAGALALLIKPFNAGKLRDAVAPLISTQARSGDG